MDKRDAEEEGPEEVDKEEDKDFVPVPPPLPEEEAFEDDFEVLHRH